MRRARPFSQSLSQIQGSRPATLPPPSSDISGLPPSPAGQRDLVRTVLAILFIGGLIGDLVLDPLAVFAGHHLGHDPGGCDLAVDAEGSVLPVEQPRPCGHRHDPGVAYRLCRAVRAGGLDHHPKFRRHHGLGPCDRHVQTAAAARLAAPNSAVQQPAYAAVGEARGERHQRFGGKSGALRRQCRRMVCRRPQRFWDNADPAAVDPDHRRDLVRRRRSGRGDRRALWPSACRRARTRVGAPRRPFDPQRGTRRCRYRFGPGDYDRRRARRGRRAAPRRV